MPVIFVMQSPFCPSGRVLLLCPFPNQPLPPRNIIMHHAPPHPRRKSKVWYLVFRCLALCLLFHIITQLPPYNHYTSTQTHSTLPLMLAAWPSCLSCLCLTPPPRHHHHTFTIQNTHKLFHFLRAPPPFHAAFVLHLYTLPAAPPPC